MSYTIKKLAEKIGVSPTAISLVINDKPNRLKPETVKLIKDSVEKYNYKQNVVARSMVTQSSMSIGLVIPDIRNPFFSEVAMGLSIELQKAGYDTFLCNTLDSNNTSIDYINKLQNRFVDGIIVITNDDFSDDDLVRLNSLRSPVIFLDRNPFNINQNYIRVNDYDGGVMAAKHLLKKYHNFACLKTHPSFSNIYDRFIGYQDTINQAGYDVVNTICEVDVDSAYRAVSELFKQNDKIDSIFCCADIMAIGVYKYAYDNNLNIPNDLAVIGFDDISISKNLIPPLSTIAQPIYQIGQTAATLILEMINEKKSSVEGKILMVSLEERLST